MPPINILIVDDEKQFRNSTARVLERRGFTVDTAESGETALGSITQHKPDIVLLDLKMEGMDGISTLEQIRKSCGDLPVIILTGHGAYNDALASIHLEVTDFLQKPVDVEKLSAKIHSVLARKSKVHLREKTVGELMVPIESYEKIYDDQRVYDLLGSLSQTMSNPVVGKVTEVGHRSIVIMDRRERLKGVFRILDVLRMALPEALIDSPYSTYFTGMFLAQCKVLGDRPIGDFLDEDDIIFISERTPLMAAMVKMIRHCLINLPVLRDGNVVGILRDKDLFFEITRNVLGE